MNRIKRLYYRARRFINVARRNRRMVFPSPAEVNFVRLFGGRVLVVPFLKDPRTGFPAAVFVSMGWFLRQEHIRREVPVGSKWIDFGNDIKRGIEIDGAEYHRDIVKEQDRKEYLEARGWVVLHIPGTHIKRYPQKVVDDVVAFLIK
jgi:hypothetical protein